MDTTTPAVGLFSEDYYGMAIDTIYFEQVVDITPEYFNGRVSSFSYSGNEETEEGTVVRIQYYYETGTGDTMDVEITTQQIMEIILEGCDEYLEYEDTVRESIMNTLDIVI